jgi:L-serine dehydratase
MRCLLGGEPASVKLTFDPEGSYAPTYVPLGVDLAFATGVMGWSMLDERYFESLTRAEHHGLSILFTVAPIEHSNHPNAVRIDMKSRDGEELHGVAEATGGGVFRVVRLEDWPVELNGKSHEVLVETDRKVEPEVAALLDDGELLVGAPRRLEQNGVVLLYVPRVSPMGSELEARVRDLSGVKNLWTSSPVFYVRRGDMLFSSAQEMVSEAERRDCSLGRIALAYESQLLGMTEDEALEEMLKRFEVMERSVQLGLDDRQADMLLLRPTASRIYEAEAKGRLGVGGIHTRAAARSMAVMHVCNSRGMVCAAPTGGSAGVIPGVVVSLVEEGKLSRDRAVLALFAAASIGLIVAQRATFAAEVAGCQVEIGVAGAMAAAAVVDAMGGTADQSAQAAAVAFQNTMGSVCDPVAGTCEIPCHTRNAVAASSAFTCADLVLGGYVNPIPLDETIDASYAVGKALPRELRCTAEGGLAVTPSARNLPRLR